MSAVRATTVTDHEQVRTMNASIVTPADLVAAYRRTEFRVADRGSQAWGYGRDPRACLRLVFTRLHPSLFTHRLDQSGRPQDVL